MRRGSTTVRSPARCAARTFSLMPPTGRTRPDRLISPVMARSERTGRPVRSDTSAVAIVTPAEGPSFGIAPAGTWTCTSERSQNSGSIPVSVSVRAPRIRVASTNSTSPPAGVQARPVTTPGTRVRCSTSSSSKRGTPRNETTTSGVTRTGSALPSARRRATFRHNDAISRSRFRTPASRV